MMGGYHVVVRRPRFGFHYGAAAMRVLFLAILYVETPVQILLQRLVLSFWRYLLRLLSYDISVK